MLIHGSDLMIQKARDDALERQASAIERVTERYKKLEEERASKRIVMIDKPPPLKKARRAGGVPHGESSTAFG